MRRGKYNAKATVVDNVRFASKREALHYMQLKALLKTGRITKLELQPKFPMPPHEPSKGVICTYISDFRITYPDGREVVHDVKGMVNRLFRIKQKMMAYWYPNVELVVVK